MSERVTPKAITAAYERGYRRGRIEAAAELHAIYRGRILDATSILSAPILQAAATPHREIVKPPAKDDK